MDGAERMVVIGSGPSGIACASGLLACGASVIMLDVGKDLDRQVASKVVKIGRKEPSNWSEEDRVFLSAGPGNEAGTIPRKRLFGDSFAYLASEVAFEDGRTPEDFAQWPSHALGGLSRVWGATMKRYSPFDLQSWPFSWESLLPHYRSVEQLIETEGALISTFGLSLQAERLLRRWHRLEKILDEKKIKITPSQLAVAFNCKLCGSCLNGCPYDFIYSSRLTLRRLKSHPNFQYVPGHRVDQVIELGDGAMVTCWTIHGKINLAAKRVYIGAGPLETARIMLSSFGPQERLNLRDSQYFLMPYLTVCQYSNSPAHTLSQLFLSLEYGANPVHVQLYGYNDVYAQQIRQRVKFLPQYLAKMISRHFLLTQSYLHSDESGGAWLTLSGTNSRLAVDAWRSSLTIPRVRETWRSLARIGRFAGLVALPSLGQIGKVGQGYHTGATMPMRTAPAGWECDLLGRPKGLKRIHVVDSSNWPNIPAGPVTLTVMANAHRIACQSTGL